MATCWFGVLSDQSENVVALKSTAPETVTHALGGLALVLSIPNNLFQPSKA